jgi:translation initiation factor IF-3
LRPFPRSFQPREPQHRRNGKIRAREVRVLDESRQPLGVMALNEALKLARDQALDLVEIVPNANPPVCRIVSYGKFLYEESKRGQGAHTKNTGNRMKEIQLSAVIDAHDFATKLNHAIGFLSEDMKVRLKLRFKGRQKAHKEVGFDVINRFVAATAAYGRTDTPPKLLGDRDLNVTIIPLPKDKRPKQKAEKATPSAESPARAAKHQPSDEVEPASDASAVPEPASQDAGE